MRFIGILLVILNSILLSASRPEIGNLSVENPKRNTIVAYYTEAPKINTEKDANISIQGARGFEGCEIYASCRSLVTNQKLRIEWITPPQTVSRREEKFTANNLIQANQLIIRNVTYNDTGYYQCNIMNEQGEVKSIGTIIKVGPILSVDPIDQQGKDKIELKVLISKYDPRFQYQWLVSRKVNGSADKIHENEKYKMHFEENSSRLTINNFTDDDVHIYGFREYYSKALVVFNITKIQNGYNVYSSAVNSCGAYSRDYIKKTDYKLYSFITA